LIRIAARFEYGAQKYGVDNWRIGLKDKDFVIDRINHAIEHLMNLKEQIHDGQYYHPDDDAAGVGWAAMLIMEHQRIMRGEDSHGQGKEEYQRRIDEKDASDAKA
jgi:hypothetical protein